MATLDRVADRVKVEAGGYAVLTLHRPSNVDVPETFKGILSAIAAIAADTPVVFPVHPRTQARVKEFGLEHLLADVQVTGPLGYIDFLSLTSHAKLVLTDSGGLQEESTALGIPCLTLRENTERPVTVMQGTNTVVGNDMAKILEGYSAAFRGYVKKRQPELWDGCTALRIRAVLERSLFG
jgi:UDP-N-acetylglucosamine 2-epimerase (non-hydrolysing)